jgi:tetratricopeptide (TPR) repeat protein
MFGITDRQLRSWEERGLIERAGTYGFAQLRILRKLIELKRQKLSTQRIERALRSVSGLPGVGNPLADAKVYFEDRRIRAQVGKLRMDAERGQFLLNFDEPGQSAVALERQEPDQTGKLRKAEQCFLRGVELEQSGGPVESVIEAYTLAADLDPKLAAAWVNLGTIYYSSQEYEKARVHYARALEANPAYPLAHFNMGNLHDEQGDHNQALVHYLSALRLDPNYADAHYNAALVYQTRGETMKALRHWRQYLRLDTAGPWAEVARRELGKLIDASVVRGRGPGTTDGGPGARQSRPSGRR